MIVSKGNLPVKSIISAAAMAAALGLCAAPAFAQPSGGPAAKGNAPLKRPHTVNDGAAKHGHNSFTEGQARTHIEKAGFTGVSSLVKGDDGVWRGQAMRDGQTRDVAMDFKGNVSTSGSPIPAMREAQPSSTPMAAPIPAPALAPLDESTSRTEPTTTTTSTKTSKHVVHHTRRHYHHHRRVHRALHRCANPAPNGAACSGVDKNGNGISDKEDRAIHQGSRP